MRLVLVMLGIAVGAVLVIGGIITAGEKMIPGATPTPVLVAVGRIAHLQSGNNQTWPIPVNRVAFDAFSRASQEGDQRAMAQVAHDYEWLNVTTGQSVTIVQVDGNATQVEMIGGPLNGRRAWVGKYNVVP